MNENETEGVWGALWLSAETTVLGSERWKRERERERKKDENDEGWKGKQGRKIDRERERLAASASGGCCWWYTRWNIRFYFRNLWLSINFKSVPSGALRAGAGLAKPKVEASNELVGYVVYRYSSFSSLSSSSSFSASFTTLTSLRVLFSNLHIRISIYTCVYTSVYRDLREWKLLLSFAVSGFHSFLLMLLSYSTFLFVDYITTPVGVNAMPLWGPGSFFGLAANCVWYSHTHNHTRIHSHTHICARACIWHVFTTSTDFCSQLSVRSFFFFIFVPSDDIYLLFFSLVYVSCHSRAVMFSTFVSNITLKEILGNYERSFRVV